MVKYTIAAIALKLFSSCRQMKSLYRSIGNIFGARNRIKRAVPRFYLERNKWFLEIIKKYNIIKNDDKILELGTGWVHWESIIIRLLYDVNITLFDVWDNRQLDILKSYFNELDENLDKEMALSDIEKDRVHGLLRYICSVSSFDALYLLLGFQYIINPEGKLSHFQDESFDVVFSFGVFEHIDKDILSHYLKDIYRILKPAGFSVHSINIGDHLYDYDKKVSAKNYLRYSDATWKLLFENKVQYFNRVQRAEWLCLFREAELDLIEQESILTNINNININKKYINMTGQDLECFLLRLVHQKRHNHL